MRIARNLLGLSDDDLAEIRDALSMLRDNYLRTYWKAIKRSVPPPYFQQYIKQAQQYPKLAHRCQKLMKLFEE
ncbi:MAG: hypothetical protein JRJ62_16590 [Deltaproteobacteria bacterium]|nr:hypothetical protein [Deltaproteobacteria bacterium]